MTEGLRAFSKAISEYWEADKQIVRTQAVFHEGLRPCDEQLSAFKNACRIKNSADSNIALTKAFLGSLVTIGSALFPNNRAIRVAGLLAGTIILAEAVCHDDVVRRAKLLTEHFEYKR